MAPSVPGDGSPLVVCSSILSSDVDEALVRPDVPLGSTKPVDKDDVLVAMDDVPTADELFSSLTSVDDLQGPS